MQPLARWHIGPVQPAGFDCLRISVNSFLELYPAEATICFNCDRELLKDWENDSRVTLLDQSIYKDSSRTPLGVAWKLYPPRLDISRKEIVIDNDIVFEERIPEIDFFLQNDTTLLCEDHTRCYGSFEQHIPPMYQINSGIYGMPEGFDLDNYVNFYAKDCWENNAKGEHELSKTFDEQGLIGLALLSYHTCQIISATTITNCEKIFKKSKGCHFIGLNRRAHHRPFQEFKTSKKKMFL